MNYLLYSRNSLFFNEKIPFKLSEYNNFGLSLKYLFYTRNFLNFIHFSVIFRKLKSPGGKKIIMIKDFILIYFLLLFKLPLVEVVYDQFAIYCETSIIKNLIWLFFEKLWGVLLLLRILIFLMLVLKDKVCRKNSIIIETIIFTRIFLR